MRDFSWNCFAVTGSIDAYLLYKDAAADAAGRNEGGKREPDEETEG